MRQESGGSMIAAARMNARAGTRRTRRRIGIGAALAVALGGGVLGFGTGGAGAAVPVENRIATLLVDTHKDIVPILPDSLPPGSGEDLTVKPPTVSTTGTPTVNPSLPVRFAALKACLQGITNEGNGDGQVDDRGLLAAVNDGLGTAESTVNEIKPDSNNALVDVRAKDPCSLRMALMAAPLIASPVAPVEDVTVGKVQINIDQALRGKIFEIEVNDAIGNDGGATVTSAPLPPIMGSQVEIDGCAGDYSSSKAPCVNLRFGRLIRVGGPARSVSEGAPGLIALAAHTTIKGFAFQGGNGPAILAPPIPLSQTFVPGRLTVQNSWFGLRVLEARTRDTNNPEAPRIGIQLSGSGGTAKNDPTVIQGNVFADEADKMTGVLIAGGSYSRIIGNFFGTDESGKATSTFGLATGVKVTGLDAVSSRQLVRTVNAAAGEDTLDPASLSLLPLATDNAIGGRQSPGTPPATSSCAGSCNVFVNAKDVAVDVGGAPFSSSGSTDTTDAPGPGGVTDTLIASNRIGIDAVGKAGGNTNGILVRNGAGDSPADNDPVGTQVGGPSQAEWGNVISNNGGPGLLVAGTDDLVFQDGADLGTVFERNVGQSNGGPVIRLGNAQTSGGIRPPTIESALPTQVSGTAPANSTVHVYLVPKSAKQGDIAGYLGEAKTAVNGTWSAAVSAPGSYVTATATIRALGTSELAANALVPEPPKPAKPADPPPPPPPPDVTAPVVKTVAGQDPEKGPVVLTPDKLKTLSGQVADESGVAKVRIALQVLSLQSARRAHAAKRERICRFVHLSKARLLRRPCSRPPYRVAQLHEAQSGDTAWRLPLSAKVRKRLKAGRYRLLVETTDTNGLTTVHRVPVVIKKKARRGRR